MNPYYQNQYNPNASNPYQPTPYQYGGMSQYNMPQYQQQQMQRPAMQQSAIKGRPVTGIEEAKAAQIDLDGSMHLFPDIANGRIYIKYVGNDGFAVFNIYALQRQPDNATQDQVDIAGIITPLRAEIDEIKAKINNYERVFLGANQPNTNNGDVAGQLQPDANITVSSG